MFQMSSDSAQPLKNKNNLRDTYVSKINVSTESGSEESEKQQNGGGSLESKRSTGSNLSQILCLPKYKSSVTVDIYQSGLLVFTYLI